MHPIAQHLRKISRHDIESGDFGPEDFKEILTAINLIAIAALGADSKLVDHIDDAHDHINATNWPKPESMCGQCSGSGEGMTDGSRCCVCRGRGVV